MEEKKKTKRTFHLEERKIQSFQRTFCLPKEISEDKINAKYSEGVLHITLPKSLDSKPKNIKILDS